MFCFSLVIRTLLKMPGDASKDYNMAADPSMSRSRVPIGAVCRGRLLKPSADMFALEAFGDMRVKAVVDILFTCASKRQICWQYATGGDLRHANHKATNVR